VTPNSISATIAAIVPSAGVPMAAAKLIEAKKVAVDTEP
jgi:hypothetical protein